MPDPPTVAVEGAAWAHVSPAQAEAARQAGVPAAFENELGMRFVYVPGGTFEMGAREAEARHTVNIGRGFYMQVDAVRGAGADRPGGGFSYVQAVAFAVSLSSKDATWTYRLPTEAEWEYACRAGTATRFWWGDDASDVARAPAHNPWGLTGMHVGVPEWVSDRWGALPSWTVSDPEGPEEGAERVVRGGGTTDQPAPASHRGHAAPEAPGIAARFVIPVRYGLGAYGSVSVTFRYIDAQGRPAEAADCDLRIISMNERLAARNHGLDPEWHKVEHPTMPWTTTMVPGAYYIFAERRHGGELARGVEQKFYVTDVPVDRPVPVPEADLTRYGSGAHSEPK